MIQRVQSLFLAGVVLISALLFTMNISEKLLLQSDGKEVMNTLSLLYTTVSGTADSTPANMLLVFLNGAVLILSLITIFKYRNRKLQMSLCMFSGILAAVLLILSFYLSGKLAPEAQQPHYLIAIYLIVIELVLLLAARRFILKDEKLVRAADRIR